MGKNMAPEGGGSKGEEGALLGGGSDKGAVTALVRRIGEGDEERFSELKGVGSLACELPGGVEELEEDGGCRGGEGGLPRPEGVPIEDKPTRGKGTGGGARTLSPRGAQSPQGFEQRGQRGAEPGRKAGGYDPWGVRVGGRGVGGRYQPSLQCTRTL